MKALIGLMLAFALVGCGNSSSNNGTASPPPAYGPPLPSGIIPQCVGTNCSYGIPQSTRIGFYAQSANLGGMFLNNGSTFNVNSAGMKGLLKDAMGICDRNTYDYGVSGCQQWINGMHDLVFMMDGSTSNSVRIMLRSYPQQNPFFVYGASFPSASQFFSTLFGYPQYNYQGMFNPLILTATIWPINNSLGFEIRANGPTGSPGYNQMLQLQVTQGKVEDERFSFVLHWNGQQAASGTLVRCQSLTCGLPL